MWCVPNGTRQVATNVLRTPYGQEGEQVSELVID